MTEIDEHEGEWTDCWNCGGSGYSHHDCGEDCCACLDPEPNVPCDICDGKGGWFQPILEQKPLCFKLSSCKEMKE